MSEISLTDALEMAAQKGAEVALKEFNKSKSKYTKEQSDKRLRNTELLLKNYRSLVIHKKDAVYSSKKAIQILDQIDYSDDDCCFDSLKNSSDRTAIVVAHINMMLDAFHYLASKKINPELLRGYKIIDALYIQDEEKSPEEICMDLRISQATFYRDKKSANLFLGGLIFGVDSLKFK